MKVMAGWGEGTPRPQGPFRANFHLIHGKLKGKSGSMGRACWADAHICSVSPHVGTICKLSQAVSGKCLQRGLLVMAADSFCCGYVPHTNALTHFQTGMHLSSVAQLSLAPGASDPGGGHYRLWLHQCVFEKQTPRLHNCGGSWLTLTHISWSWRFLLQFEGLILLFGSFDREVETPELCCHITTSKFSEKSHLRRIFN